VSEFFSDTSAHVGHVLS